MKKDYRKQIHELCEEMRSEIEVKNILHVRRLEYLEQLEEDSLKENSLKAVKRIKMIITKRKQRVFTLPYARKRIEFKGEKILITSL